MYDDIAVRNRAMHEFSETENSLYECESKQNGINKFHIFFAFLIVKSLS